MFLSNKKSKAKLGLVFLLTMLCAMSVVLSACGKKNNQSSSQQESTATEDVAGKELENIYECNLKMGDDLYMMLYMKIDGDGNFVFSRNTDFSNNEKGAGVVIKTADGEYSFEYSVVNGESVESGKNVATAKLGNDKQIIFTSPMWFGATSPKLETDGVTTYPEFVISNGENASESAEATTEAAATDAQTDAATTANTTTAAVATEAAKAETKGPAADNKQETTAANVSSDKNSGSTSADTVSLKTGFYSGTLTTTAMGSQLVYSYSITFNEDNTYKYAVSFNVMGSDYNEEETGTYAVSGDTFTLTRSDGTVMSGNITGATTATLTRNVSSFAFSETTINLTYGG